MGNMSKGGDKLGTFDSDNIKNVGLEMTTIVIVTNSADCSNVISNQEMTINSGDDLLMVKR